MIAPCRSRTCNLRFRSSLFKPETRSSTGFTIPYYIQIALFFKGLVRIWYALFQNAADKLLLESSPVEPGIGKILIRIRVGAARFRLRCHRLVPGAGFCVRFLSHGSKLSVDSSVALAFAVGRGYEATDAVKRLKFGASPADGVAETGISAPLEPELSQRPGLHFGLIAALVSLTGN